MAKHVPDFSCKLQVQMKFNCLTEGPDIEYSILHSFKLDFDSNGAYEKAIMWWVPFWMKETPAAAFFAALSLKARSSTGASKKVCSHHTPKFKSPFAYLSN